MLPPMLPGFVRCAAALLLLAFLLSAQGPTRARKLSGPLPLGVAGDVEDFALAPDGTRIAFRADVREEGRFALFAVPSDGSTMPVRLTGPLVEDGSVQSGYAITPDGTRAVYRADEDVDEAFELFVVPLDGSSVPLRLNGPLVAGGAVQDFRLSPDGTRVVYLADQNTDERALLFSVPIDRSASPVVLNGPLAAGGDVQTGAEITSDGSRVVYLADQDTNGVIELYSAPIAGGAAPVKLNAPLAADGDVSLFRIGPDGARVLYAAKEAADGDVRMHSVPTGGGTSVPLFSGAFQPFEQFEIDPLSLRVVYQRWTGTAYVLESQPIDGSAAAISLHGALLPGRSIADFALSPDALRVVFIGDLDTDNMAELYSVPIDASAAPVKLNGTLPAGGDIWEPLVSPDGGSVLYVASGAPSYSLEVAAIDGSAAPIQLLSAASFQELRFSPDGTLAFLLEGGATPALLSVPADGSASAAAINLPGGTVQPDFAVFPDGARVFYRTDHDAFGVFELFATPSTTAAPVQLNQEFPPNTVLGSVRYFAQAAGRAIYVADGDTVGRYELYGVATHGPPAAVKLNAPLVAGGQVFYFPFLFSSPLLSLDGSRAFYLTDQDVDGVVELFSVPSDGSLPPVRLNGTLGALADVSRFDVSAGGTRIAYLADQDVDEAYELYGSFADGSLTSVKLNTPLGASQDVLDFRLTADGSRFSISGDGTQVLFTLSDYYGTELFASPIVKSAAGAATPSETVVRQP